MLNIAWKFKENLSFGKKLWSIVYQNMHISENILSVADISRGYQGGNYQLQLTEIWL